jgi:flavodoxin
MKIGIVYYSRTGNTREAATILQEKFKEKKADVDMIEIEHVKRPGFFSAGRASNRQLELPIKNTEFNMGKYDVIVAGSPTWAGKPSPFITTFMNKAVNMKGKKVCVFGTGMSPIDKRDQFKEIINNNFKQAGIKTVDAFLTLNYRRGHLADGQQHIDAFVNNCLGNK